MSGWWSTKWLVAFATCCIERRDVASESRSVRVASRSLFSCSLSPFPLRCYLRETHRFSTLHRQTDESCGRVTSRYVGKDRARTFRKWNELDGIPTIKALAKCNFHRCESLRETRQRWIVKCADAVVSLSRSYGGKLERKYRSRST